MDRKSFRRICALLMVVTLAIGAALHGVQAADMAVKMAAMAASDSDMPGGCKGCGAKDGMPPSGCDLMCPSSMAVIPARVVLLVPPASAVDIKPVYPGATRTEPPEPHPPRTSTMI